MPSDWLSIKYPLLNLRRRVGRHFAVESIPSLLLFNQEGEFFDSEAVTLIKQGKSYMSLHYLLRKKDPSALSFPWHNGLAATQSALLLSTLRDAVCTSHGVQVPSSDLFRDSQVVGIYFSGSSCTSSKKVSSPGYPFS